VRYALPLSVAAPCRARCEAQRRISTRTGARVPSAESDVTDEHRDRDDLDARVAALRSCVHQREGLLECAVGLGHDVFGALLHWRIVAVGGEGGGMRLRRSRPVPVIQLSAFKGFRFPPEIIVLAVG
jgi:hypothetical protein